MNWISSHAMVLGNKYKNDPRKCQDYAISWNDEYGAFIAVCDGAGSASKSHIGAKRIAEDVSNYFKKDFKLRIAKNTISSYELNHSIINVCKNAIKNLIMTENTAPLDDAGKNNLFFSYDTTLIFLYHDKSYHTCYSGHIGDGMLIGIKRDGFDIISKPSNGGASNLTDFVTTAITTNKDLLRMSIIPGNEYIGYVCFSDGPEDAYRIKGLKNEEYYKDNNMPPIRYDLLELYNKILVDPHILENHIKNELVDNHICDDDCSIAIIGCGKIEDYFIDKLKQIEQDRQQGLKKNIFNRKIQIQISMRLSLEILDH